MLDLASSPWLYPLVFALVVGDAFLVVLPSETVVVALGALAGATGTPWPAVLVPVAAVGAVTGDLLCFLIGRRVGLDRWAWQRRGRVAAALGRAQRTVERRTAVLIFTARYIPFARIAVNLSAGASGIPLGRFLPLSAARCPNEAARPLISVKFLSLDVGGDFVFKGGRSDKLEP